MKTSLDCIPCFLRQALDVARLSTADASIHERIIRDVLQWAGGINLDQPPPLLAQRIHRRLRELTGMADPYRAAKDRHNAMALKMLPRLRTETASASDPLIMAVRLSIAGNIIDMGVNGGFTETDLRRSLDQALAEPFSGDPDGFRKSVAQAANILYLADNAGEIAFDRLLIEQLPTENVTVAVRGAPVINDATMADALASGLQEIAEVIDNGSDAPGTVLADCSREFNRRFDEADLILAKGQGNFETLSDENRNIYFLLKAKCPVIASHIGLPVGTHILKKARPSG
ncbi:MAG: ARMT1-like domain-containing protein [Syntrophus sp. (in: bacteria)]|nr:ARMT1-like domain-containing protein [Syntrophus sp. (in: bacteria)]